MADKFKVGQRVIWAPGAPAGDGTERYTGTIIQERRMRRFEGTGSASLRYRLDLDGYGAVTEGRYCFAALERELRPLYDGDQPASWADCAWKPREVAHG